jgi:hypothetical protein
MGKYYKFKDKMSGVIRPVLPTDFTLSEGVLMWDDTDAVYDAGEVECSKDKETWERFGFFLPDDGKIDALTGKLHYRLRVKYNTKWSEYLYAVAVKAEVVKKVAPKKKK